MGNCVIDYKSDLKIPLKNLNKLPLPYVGNKKKLASKIHETIVNNNINFHSVLDVFSGSASVSYIFKVMGKDVIANDILQYAYMNAISLIQNEGIALTEAQKEYLLYFQNPNRNFFVEKNYLGENLKGICKNENSESRYRKFTLKECQFLDNFRANLREFDPSHFALAFSAIAAIVLRLPFGNIDQSTDIMKHRIRQEKTYGKGSDRHDRRIGIYYDDKLNLNFEKWFLKYCGDYEQGQIPSQYNQKSEATNMDVYSILKNPPFEVDCVYFDPPYGGVSSNYAHMYRFFEEYFHQCIFEDLPYAKDALRFVGKPNYERNFSAMLEAAEKIPIWIFSYNDKSWQDIEHIAELVREHRENVVVETVSQDYKYIYREQCGNKTKAKEYLIIAH